MTGVAARRCSSREFSPRRNVRLGLRISLYILSARGVLTVAELERGLVFEQLVLHKLVFKLSLQILHFYLALLDQILQLAVKLQENLLLVLVCQSLLKGRNPPSVYCLLTRGFRHIRALLDVLGILRGFRLWCLLLVFNVDAAR